MSSNKLGYLLNANLERTRTLPDELLAFIFELCLPTTRNYTHDYDFPLTKHAPISVMHVCSRWRKIAISNSKLWSELYLGTQESSERRLGLLKDILAVWEERSRRQPMVISLSLPPPYCHPMNRTRRARRARQSVDARLQLHRQAWASLLPQLTLLLAHCKRLEVGYATEDVLRVIDAFDSIQELVYSYDKQGIAWHLPHPTFSIKLLQLHTFECRIMYDSHDECISISPEELLGNAGLPSTKLRKLALAGGISTRNFVMLATLVPTLEELDIRITCAEGSQNIEPLQPMLPSSKVPPLHSSLIRLSIDVDISLDSLANASDFQNALNNLSFPHLRYLQLYLSKEPPTHEPVARSIAAVLQRSQSPVDTLRLCLPNPQDEATIVALLRAVPRLEWLHLYSLRCEDVEVVVRAFMTTTTELLCPHLNRISFALILWREPEDYARILVEFVSARFATPANKLSRLVFVTPDPCGFDGGMRKVCAMMTGSAQFGMYKERGLELQTVYEDIEYV
jgi:hypothetical protein